MICEREQEYYLRLSDFDQFGRMQPAAVLDAFQEIATVQAVDMHVSKAEMAAQGVFWVVVRTKYQVLSQPEPHQTVLLRTWPHSPSRFAFQRDYSIKSLQGEMLIKGTSEWVLVDLEKRSFARLSNHYHGGDIFSDDRAFEGKPRKCPDFDIEGLQPRVVVPGASDIDVNGHVNNSRYAAYAIDAVEIGEGDAIETFQIDFRHEVLAGEPLKVFAGKGIGADGETLVKGINENGDVSFSCKIEFAGR